MEVRSIGKPQMCSVPAGVVGSKDNEWISCVSLLPRIVLA
jgi:hypothetical protein